MNLLFPSSLGDALPERFRNASVHRTSSKKPTDNKKHPINPPSNSDLLQVLIEGTVNQHAANRQLGKMMANVERIRFSVEPKLLGFYHLVAGQTLHKLRTPHTLIGDLGVFGQALDVSEKMGAFWGA